MEFADGTRRIAVVGGILREEIIILISCLRLRLYDYAGERVYSHGSLSQVTRANFVESDLAVAVISVDPAWGFQKERKQRSCVRILCNTQYCNQLREDEVDHEIGIRHL